MITMTRLPTRQVGYSSPRHSSLCSASSLLYVAYFLYGESIAGGKTEEL
jgi:hypothetical protein